MPSTDVVSELLEERFVEFGEAPAFIEKGRTTSFAQLASRIAAWKDSGRGWQ